MQQSSRIASTDTRAPLPILQADPNALSVVLAAIQDLAAKVDAIRDELAGRTKPFFSVEEVAGMMDRAEYTVRTWIREGHLRAIRVGNSGPRGRLLIPREELQRLVESGRGSNVPAETFESE